MKSMLKLNNRDHSLDSSRRDVRRPKSQRSNSNSDNDRSLRQDYLESSMRSKLSENRNSRNSSRSNKDKVFESELDMKKLTKSKINAHI